MHLSFAMRDTCLRQLLAQEVENMEWRRPDSNPQPRAKSRSLEGAHSRSAKAQVSCGMREMFVLEAVKFLRMLVMQY